MRFIQREEMMTKWIAVVFALAFVPSALAMPRVPLQAPEALLIQVRHTCGPGMHMVNGVCLRTPARRAASRCARGVTC